MCEKCENIKNSKYMLTCILCDNLKFCIHCDDYSGDLNANCNKEDNFENDFYQKTGNRICKNCRFEYGPHINPKKYYEEEIENKKKLIESQTYLVSEYTEELTKLDKSKTFIVLNTNKNKKV
jgi:hypothetical protein